jgi:hypothetical protein
LGKRYKNEKTKSSRKPYFLFDEASDIHYYSNHLDLVNDAKQTRDFLEELNDYNNAMRVNKFVVKKHSVFGYEAQKQGHFIDNAVISRDLATDCEYSHIMMDEEFNLFYEKAKYLERNKKITKKLRGTLWDVPYLLLSLKNS